MIDEAAGATDKEPRVVVVVVVVRIFRQILIEGRRRNPPDTKGFRSKVADFAAMGIIVLAKFRSIMKIAPRYVCNRDTPVGISCLRIGRNLIRTRSGMNSARYVSFINNTLMKFGNQ